MDIIYNRQPKQGGKGVHVCLLMCLCVGSSPPYMMVALLLNTSLHWSRAGTVCSRWNVRRSH